jgi:hypothetical protein
MSSRHHESALAFSQAQQRSARGAKKRADGMLQEQEKGRRGEGMAVPRFATT